MDITTTANNKPALAFIAGCGSSKPSGKLLINDLIKDYAQRIHQAAKKLERAERLKSNPYARQIQEIPGLLSSSQLSSADKMKFILSALKTGDLELQLTTLRSLEKRPSLARKVKRNPEIVLYLNSLTKRTISSKASYIRQAKLRSLAKKYLRGLKNAQGLCNFAMSRMLNKLHISTVERAVRECTAIAIKYPGYDKCVAKAARKNSKKFDAIKNCASVFLKQ